jgi:hypothetical protein
MSTVPKVTRTTFTQLRIQLPTMSRPPTNFVPFFEQFGVNKGKQEEKKMTSLPVKRPALPDDVSPVPNKMNMPLLRPKKEKVEAHNIFWTCHFCGNKIMEDRDFCLGNNCRRRRIESVEAQLQLTLKYIEDLRVELKHCQVWVIFLYPPDAGSSPSCECVIAQSPPSLAC